MNGPMRLYKFKVERHEARQTIAGFQRARLRLSHYAVVRLTRQRRVHVGSAHRRDSARPLRHHDRVEARSRPCSLSAAG